MIKILHGENIVESRQVLVAAMEKARNEGIEVVNLAGSQATLGEIRNNLQSGCLLGKNRLVVIENLLSSLRSKEKTKILEYLNKGKFDNDLILWEEKEIKKTVLPPVAEAEIFKVNPIIFRFLESLRSGNNQEMLELLTQVKRQEEPEMIFYMLIRQLRLLILAKDQALAGLPDWQKRKLTNQARRFDLGQLKNLYRQLAEIDFAQKTSGDPYSLFSRLDLLIAGL